MQRVHYDDLDLDDGLVLCKDRVPFTGTAYELSPTGHLIGEACFVCGVQEGPAHDFFPNGQLASKDQYRNGSKHGECWRWYASGQPHPAPSMHIPSCWKPRSGTSTATSCVRIDWPPSRRSFGRWNCCERAHRRGSS